MPTLRSTIMGILLNLRSLTVRENNKAAIALYKKFGFVAEGIHINGVCIDGQYENHIFMALLFDA
ncbi:MAG: GNAT family protein [Legionellaceae bacterium]|nr:GNAT family protein [Legionellaceae bacterium]